MAIQEIYLKGAVKWAKVQKADDNYDKTAKEWSISHYFTDESRAVFEASGLTLKIREDDEGEFVQFRRPCTKMINGDLKTFDKPAVIDDTNTELDCLIGNGSDCTVKVKVYDTKMGKGHQLEGLRVHDLVEYEGVEVLDPIGTDAPF